MAVHTEGPQVDTELGNRGPHVMLLQPQQPVGLPAPRAWCAASVPDLAGSVVARVLQVLPVHVVEGATLVCVQLRAGGHAGFGLQGSSTSTLVGVNHSGGTGGRRGPITYCSVRKVDGGLHVNNPQDLAKQGACFPATSFSTSRVTMQLSSTGPALLCTGSRQGGLWNFLHTDSGWLSDLICF